jgi:hypothetical protein
MEKKKNNRFVKVLGNKVCAKTHEGFLVRDREKRNLGFFSSLKKTLLYLGLRVGDARK